MEQKRRDYTNVGKGQYEKEEINQAINTIEWENFRKTNLPFCQGESLKTVIRECKVPISKISKMALHGCIKNTHGFYGLDVDYKNAKVQLYIADNGCSCCVVACDVEEKNWMSI